MGQALCCLGWVLVLALAVPLAARADASPQTDLALLNQERAYWGLPGGITENPAWSSDCAAHDNYERQNGGGLTHLEEPGQPGYTDGGAFAGENSILSAGAPWRAAANPFEDAPIHLIQFFTPSLAQVGIDDSAGYVCVTTWPGMAASPQAQETISTYPGDGSTGFPTTEDAEEGPFVPGDFVGLPQGTTAGRELFIYRDEPGQPGPAPVTIERASLTAPNGSLAIRTVDNTTDTIGPYLTGAIIIPVSPLPAGVRISASVTLAGSTGPITHSWTFTTVSFGSPGSGGSGGGSNQPHSHSKLKVASLRVRGHHITVRISAPAGARLQCSLTPRYRHGWSRDRFHRCWQTTIYGHVRSGRYRLTVSTQQASRRVYLRVR